MAFGLGLHAVTGVDQDDGQIAGGRAGRHVAGVLLMSRRIGNNKFACGRRSISHLKHCFSGNYFIQSVSLLSGAGNFKNRATVLRWFPTSRLETRCGKL